MVVDPRMRRFDLPSDAPFSPAQRAWLEGFLAGFGAPGAATGVGTAAPPPPPLTIVYASQTGTAESLAKKLAKAARVKGRAAKAVDIQSLDLTSLASLSPLAIVASTHGEGDPPDPARAMADVACRRRGRPAGRREVLGACPRRQQLCALLRLSAVISMCGWRSLAASVCSTVSIAT